MDFKTFDQLIGSERIRTVDRAVAIIWLAHTAHGLPGLSAREIAKIIEVDCGHPSQNIGRLNLQLKSDSRTSKYGTTGFRLRPAAAAALAKKYSAHLGTPSRPMVELSERVIIPKELFSVTQRAFLVRLVDQINGCYQHGYLDGVMTLGRKLLECLVIEAYVQSHRSNEIKKPHDGTFFTLDDLIGKICADPQMHPTRECKKALIAMKKFGDQSAHNPRFTARASDVDELKAGLRIAAEELMHFCNFADGENQPSV